jgi:hypothetical protein
MKKFEAEPGAHGRPHLASLGRRVRRGPRAQRSFG